MRKKYYYDTAVPEWKKSSGTPSAAQTVEFLSCRDNRQYRCGITDDKERLLSQEPTKPTEGDSFDDYVTEYERFLNMSPSEQKTYVESFPSVEAFFAWYNAAKEAYEAANPPIEVGDETIDMGDIIEGKD